MSGERKISNLGTELRGAWNLVLGKWSIVISQNFDTSIGEQSAEKPRFVFAKYHIPIQSSSPSTLTTVRVSL